MLIKISTLLSEGMHKPVSILLMSAMTAGIFTAASQELSFRGNYLPVITETPERATGLDKIYVLHDTDNVDLLYPSQHPGQVKIYRYSNLGGGFAEEVTDVTVEDDSAVIKNVEGNLGYIIEDNGNRYYFWIVNYHPYEFNISLVSAGEPDCDATYLNVEGKGDPIHYFTINGQQRTLDREISVVYDTQEWDVSLNEFSSVESVKYFESLTNPIRIVPPAYCSTSFTVSGDKFLRQWNLVSDAESIVISPSAVMIHTEAIQEGKESISGGNRSDGEDAGEDDDNSGNDDNEGQEETKEPASNQIPTASDGLGGSAPATISFNAYKTEGVLHDEWQLTRDQNFEDIEYRFNQSQIDYTFTEEGTYYMRFVGANADGSCEATGEVYTINIGASELKCPNAFTPDGDGVNDEWKVSYRSLLSFKCWIFDRFGNQIFYFSDPSMGWDGKRGGKLVQPGVYYYVIQAEGADGKRYKKSGDINILRHRNASSSSSGTTTTPTE